MSFRFHSCEDLDERLVCAVCGKLRRPLLADSRHSQRKEETDVFSDEELTSLGQ